MSSRKLSISSSIANKRETQNVGVKRTNKCLKKEKGAKSLNTIDCFFHPILLNSSDSGVSDRLSNDITQTVTLLESSSVVGDEVIPPSPQMGKMKNDKLECMLENQDLSRLQSTADGNKIQHISKPSKPNFSKLKLKKRKYSNVLGSTIIFGDRDNSKKCSTMKSKQTSTPNIVKDDIYTIIDSDTDNSCDFETTKPNQLPDTNVTKKRCSSSENDIIDISDDKSSESHSKKTKLLSLKTSMKRRCGLSPNTNLNKKLQMDHSDMQIEDFDEDGNTFISDINFDDSLLDVDFDSVMSNSSDDEDPSVMLTWIVTDIKISDIDITGNLTKEKVLTLILEDGDLDATCSLRNDWYYMEIEVNDNVYVSGLSKSKRSCILDNMSKHYLISYPNTLIAGTTISAGITCERMAVLNERFKTNFTGNIAMFLGTITHELFDWVLKHKNCTVDDLETRARENLKKSMYLESLSVLGVDVDEMIEKQKEYIHSLVHWSKQFMRDQCDTEIDFKTGQEKGDNFVTTAHIDKIIDIEENIWSPYYGLKGKIDASVEVTIHRKPKLKGQMSTKRYSLPLEFKTGKLLSKLGSIEHRAQVTVYTLLMSEKYKLPIDSGLLLYSKTNHMLGIPRPEQEKRAILIKRNEIASHLTLERPTLKLPGLIQNERLCKRCSQNGNCMLYFKAMENGDALSSGVGELFTQLTSHLHSEDLLYFAKWYELSILEAGFTNKDPNDKYLWKKSSNEREKHGICFSGMKSISFEWSNIDAKFLYKFRRKENHFNSGCSLKFIPLGNGERVIISEENVKVFNITTGYIVDVTFDVVSISVYNEVKSLSSNTTYRIDRDDTLSNYTTPLSNLCQLFTYDSATDEKLRKLIIMGEKPKFSEEKAQDIACLLQISEDSLEDSITATQGKALNDVFTELNSVQRSSIERCLTADDYVIILGMPGAGKSTTIACLVRALASIGKSVLLTSYTHSAVDTILIKLLKVGFNDFVRIGQSTRVHSKILPYTYQQQSKSFTTAQDFKNFYSKQNVVATTCLGINHPLFMLKRFDYCIVDEASQITQPVCIGPIRNADVFVLVGDNNQLPPLVLNPEARERGLDCSLFKSLADLHPEDVFMLNYQYRMNNLIMLLTNTLVYDNRMKCGNKMVADSLLKLQNYDRLLLENMPCQLWDIVNPKNPVVFVNTDGVELKEEKFTSFIINRGEAALVKRIIDILIQCGLPHKEIGVISMYRHQVNIIREQLVGSTGFIEVDTMDKYQGKDKTCIIVSLVRSNTNSEVGELLKDWRRINVAITRAKTKLILIGSRKTIVNSEILCKLVDLVVAKDWCIELKE